MIDQRPPRRRPDPALGPAARRRLGPQELRAAARRGQLAALIAEHQPATIGELHHLAVAAGVVKASQDGLTYYGVQRLNQEGRAGSLQQGDPTREPAPYCSPTPAAATGTGEASDSTTTSGATQPPPVAVSEVEASFRDEVWTAAMFYGWRCLNGRASTLCLWHAGRQRVLFVILAVGADSPQRQEVLASLQAAGADVRLVTQAEWPALAAELKGETPPAPPAPRPAPAVPDHLPQRQRAAHHSDPWGSPGQVFQA